MIGVSLNEFPVCLYSDRIAIFIIKFSRLMQAYKLVRRDSLPLVGIINTQTHIAAEPKVSS